MSARRYKAVLSRTVGQGWVVRDVANGFARTPFWSPGGFIWCQARLRSGEVWFRAVSYESYRRRVGIRLPRKLKKRLNSSAMRVPGPGEYTLQEAWAAELAEIKAREVVRALSGGG